MHLYDIPMIFVLIGLVLYTVLGGADFGAGLWQLIAGTGEGAARIRDHAHHSMAAVWEANHVWLIFVLTLTWTAYPQALGSIASTLAVPLFIAGIGIVFRGAAYALRSGASSPRELRVIDTVFSLSSILTPFALGAAVGAIASRRVPVGNAAGHLFSSWLNPTSVCIGALAVASAGYLAAVYLAADAARLGADELEGQFRQRALASGLIAGALAVAGLLVLRSDAHPLYRHLVDGDGLPALAVSLLAGLSTLALVYRRRFSPARYTAALAVAAIIAGWALAQQPRILPGLSISQAAASNQVLVAVIVAVVAGGAILFPSLALLFRLMLGGHFDPTPPAAQPGPCLPCCSPPQPRTGSSLAPPSPACSRASASSPWPTRLGRTRSVSSSCSPPPPSDSLRLRQPRPPPTRRTMATGNPHGQMVGHCGTAVRGCAFTPCWRRDGARAQLTSP